VHAQIGVAIIAFGTLEKHNIAVPIVPIGLSYFRGHRFRLRLLYCYTIYKLTLLVSALSLSALMKRTIDSATTHDGATSSEYQLATTTVSYDMFIVTVTLNVTMLLYLNTYTNRSNRGRAVVEFGPPIRISQELQDLYRTNKRLAYTALMVQIEDSMRSCIVTAPDYNALKLVYTARRLYQPSYKIPTPEQKQDMNRRFAEGYKMLLQVGHQHYHATETSLHHVVHELIEYRPS
jgi:1-acyl-sn-glycerol-3-phosphate acyltransferase